MPTRKSAVKRTRRSRQVKLAEALSQRADLQKRIDHVKQRLQRNALVQQGEAPAEDPTDLLREFEGMVNDLELLIQRINRTNSATQLSNGRSISDAIAERDVARIRHGVYRELAAAGTVTHSRLTRSEVKFKAAVDVSRLQKRADESARRHREIDEEIQQANWATELLD